MRKSWQLRVEHPNGRVQQIHLNTCHRIHVGESPDNDVCIHSSQIPSKHTLLSKHGRYWRLHLTEEIEDSLAGYFETLTPWSTKLYKGQSYQLNGPTSWTIANIDFSLKEPPTFSYEPRSNYENSEALSTRQRWALFGSCLLFHTLLLLFIEFLERPQPEIGYQQPTPPSLAMDEALDTFETMEAHFHQPAPQKSRPSTPPMRGILKANKPTRGSARRQADTSPRSTVGQASFITASGLNTIGFGTENESSNNKTQEEIHGSEGKNKYIQLTKFLQTQRKQEKFEIQGALEAGVVQKIVEERLHEIRNCYERTLLRSPDTAGSTSTHWTITSAGGTRDVESHSDTINEKSFHQCIEGRIARWKFPKPRGEGSVYVEYPFLFRPQDTEVGEGRTLQAADQEDEFL